MKKKIGFTVEEKIIKEFRELANSFSLNQSDYVEKCLLKYIESHREFERQEINFKEMPW